jgi:hypothetical protein
MSHVAAISTKCCRSPDFAARFASLRHSSARLVQSVEVRMAALVLNLATVEAHASIAVMDNDCRGSKASEISRDTQFGVFQLL